MFESEKSFTKESIEDTKEGIKTRRFTYVDKTNYPNDKIVFECDAMNILEADALYKEATGKDVSKQNYIGCQIAKK